MDRNNREHLTFSYKTPFSPNPAKTAIHHASSRVVPVEYNNASADKSSSWKPSTRMSGSSSATSVDDEDKVVACVFIDCVSDFTDPPGAVAKVL